MYLLDGSTNTVFCTIIMYQWITFALFPRWQHQLDLYSTTTLNDHWWWGAMGVDFFLFLRHLPRHQQIWLKMSYEDFKFWAPKFFLAPTKSLGVFQNRRNSFSTQVLNVSANFTNIKIFEPPNFFEPPNPAGAIKTIGTHFQPNSWMLQQISRQ